MNNRDAIAQALMARRRGSGILPARAVQPAFVPVIPHDEMSMLQPGAGTADFSRMYSQAAGSGGDEERQREIAKMLIGFS